MLEGWFFFYSSKVRNLSSVFRKKKWELVSRWKHKIFKNRSKETWKYLLWQSSLFRAITSKLQESKFWAQPQVTVPMAASETHLRHSNALRQELLKGWKALMNEMHETGAGRWCFGYSGDAQSPGSSSPKAIAGALMPSSAEATAAPELGP